MVRLSTVAVSTFVPALKVRSTTLPESTFFSVVRTNAPPLPGLTCWNSTTAHRSPSRLSTSPFFTSLVVATVDSSLSSVGDRARNAARTSLPAGGDVTQGEVVTVAAQTADDPGRHGRHHRVVPELLPRVDVGDVHLDQRPPQQRARVAQRVGVVRP